ncbi:hypothetical protein AMECASPLE_020677, partial [Ameca splendens]
SCRSRGFLLDSITALLRKRLFFPSFTSLKLGTISRRVFSIIVLLMTQFGTSFIHQTEGLTFNSRILWYTKKFLVDSMTARYKKARIIIPPLLCYELSVLFGLIGLIILMS